MTKLLLIIRREYFSRIKKPSFILLSLITPFFISALMLAPMGINKSNFTQTRVLVFDNTHVLGTYLTTHDDNRYVTYEIQDEHADFAEISSKYDLDDNVLVLDIPQNFIKNQAPAVELYNKNTPALYAISKIKNDLYDIRKKLVVYSTFKLNLERFEQKMNSPVSVIFHGEGLNPQMKFFVGFAAALILYLLIIMYGVQVMRSVMEEKSNRIVEIIISSVTPSTLMKGKIMGVGLVGISQFIIITLLSTGLIGLFSSYFDIETGELITQQLQMLNSDQQQVTNAVQDIPLFNIELQHYINNLSSYIPSLLFIIPVFFILGFYLYASLFAAVGSAIDNETDTQQFILPITIPLIISGSIAYSVLQHPNSDLAFWSSLFPFSSPIVMPARLAFMDLSSDWWQIVVSIGILLITVIGATKLSGRIYRTGILMYGQKVTYKTIWKWFKQSN